MTTATRSSGIHSACCNEHLRHRNLRADLRDRDAKIPGLTLMPAVAGWIRHPGVFRCPKQKTICSRTCERSWPRKKTLTWVDRLPDDVRAEVEDVRTRFIGGEFGNKATATWLSNTLAQSLQARGFSVGPHAVMRWLKVR